MKWVGPIGFSMPRYAQRYTEHADHHLYPSATLQFREVVPLTAALQNAWPIVVLVDGSAGSPFTGLAKSNAPVRSPQTWRRQALMLGQVAGVPRAAVQVSRKRITEVWS